MCSTVLGVGKHSNEQPMRNIIATWAKKPKPNQLHHEVMGILWAAQWQQLCLFYELLSTMKGLSEGWTKLKAKEVLLGKGVGVHEKMRHKLKLRGQSSVCFGQCRNTRASLERVAMSAECRNSTAQGNNFGFLNITLPCSVSIILIISISFLTQISSFLFGSWFFTRMAQHTAHWM